MREKIEQFLHHRGNNVVDDSDYKNDGNNDDDNGGHYYDGNNGNDDKCGHYDGNNYNDGGHNDDHANEIINMTKISYYELLSLRASKVKPHLVLKHAEPAK